MEKNINDIWKDIYKDMSISEDQKLTFDLMISETTLEKIDYDKKIIFITTKNKINELILKNDFYDDLNKVINQKYNNFNLKILYKNDYEKLIKNETENKKVIVNKRDKEKNNLSLNPEFTFENFVVSKDNNLLYNAAKAISKNESKSWNPFFIHGKSGLGKTHLLHAIGNDGFKNHSYKSIKYIEAKDFGNIVINILTSKKDVNQRVENLKREFLDYDLLLVDDVQFIQTRDKTKEIFFYIFDSFIKNNKEKQIVVTSDQDPEELTHFEERFITRFKSGLLLTITPPDQKTAKEILKMKIKKIDGLDENQIEEDAIAWLANNFGKNVRFLEGALNKLILFTINTNINENKIKLSDVIKIFNDSSSINKKTTKENILFAVSKYFGISKKDLLSPSRKKEIVSARNISIYLTRELLDDSLIEIGRFFKRDHSTILNSLKKIEKQIKTDVKFNDLILEIKRKI